MLTTEEKAQIDADAAYVASQCKDRNCRIAGHAGAERARWDEVEATMIDPGNERPTRTCPTKTPELHELGEFPMSCYNCHMEADS